MSQFNTIKNNFSSGVIAKKFLGRVDADIYKNSAEIIENWFCNPQGGAIRRPGTQLFLSSIKTTGANVTKVPAMLPFIIDEDNAYIVVIDTETISGGDLSIYNRSGTQQTISTTVFSNIVFETVYGENTTHDNDGFRYATSGNVMVITHASGKIIPIVIVRVVSLLGAVSFVVEPYYGNSYTLGTGILPLGNVNTSTVAVNIQQAMRIPYNPPNTNPDILLRPAATSGINVDVFAEDTLSNPVNLFEAGLSPFEWLMQFIKINQGTNTGIAKITQRVSASQVKVRVLVNFAATTASDNWQFQSWSTNRGWPQNVTFYEGRLIFGSTKTYPNGVWGSLVNNFFHMMSDKLLQDSSTDISGLNFFGAPGAIDPFNFNVELQISNAIKWMTSHKQIQIGTVGGETTMEGSEEQLINATSINVRNRTSKGGASAQAIIADKNTIFISKDGKKLYEFAIDPNTLEYIAKNLNALNDEIFEWNGYNSDTEDIVEPHTLTARKVVWQPSRNMLWVVTKISEQLVCLTFDKEFAVTAWQTITLGGITQDGSGNDIPPKIKDICAVLNSAGTHEDIYIAVERYINSATVVTMEKIGPDFRHPLLDNESTDTYDIPFFVDSAIYVQNSPASTTVAGMTHLVGETVQALADGVYVGEFVVDGAGQITLNSAASNIVVGLKYTSRIKTVRLEAGQDFETSQGKLKRISEVRARMDRTFGLKFGVDESALQNFSFDTGTPQPLFSGDKQLYLEMGPDEDSQFFIVMDEPYPATVNALILEGETND